MPRVLAPLSRVDREILMLTAWEELSPKEIGYVMGCWAAAARSDCFGRDDARRSWWPRSMNTARALRPEEVDMADVMRRPADEDPAAALGPYDAAKLSRREFSPLPGSRAKDRPRLAAIICRGSSRRSGGISGIVVRT